MKPSILVLLLSFLVAVGACDDASAGLDDARARWRRGAITDYAFDYHTTGFAPHVDITITVRDGAVTAVDDLGSGPIVDPEHAPTIETLFDQVERALDDNADVDVTWDPALGFPVRAYFDDGQEGSGFEISSFQRAP